MPSIDELEDIISSAYTEFEVFQEKYYWSCQPAYMYNSLYETNNFNGYLKKLNNETAIDGHLYFDNINNARATRMIYQGEGVDPAYLSAKSGIKQHNKGCLTDGKAVEINVDIPDRYGNTIQLILDDGNKARTELCRVRAIYKP